MQCSHHFFFLDYSLKTHVLGQLEAPTHPHMSLWVNGILAWWGSTFLPCTWKPSQWWAFTQAAAATRTKRWLTGEGWMDGLIEVISHAEIKYKHRRKTACLCMIIISGGSREILSEAAVIPLIKSTYRISSWLCHFIERKHSSWLLEQSPNLLLYAFWSRYGDFYATLHRFHPGHLTENGLSSGPASARLDRRPTGCESFCCRRGDSAARNPSAATPCHTLSISLLGKQVLNKKWAEQSWSQTRSAIFLLRTNCWGPQTYSWYMKLRTGHNQCLVHLMNQLQKALLVNFMGFF